MFFQIHAAYPAYWNRKNKGIHLNCMILKCYPPISCFDRKINKGMIRRIISA